MINALKFALVAALLVPALAHATEAGDSQELLARTKCSAQRVDRYYCPVTQNWWEGPFSDDGCSVKCQAGERAVCVAAGCDNGRPVPSSCECH